MLIAADSAIFWDRLTPNEVGCRLSTDAVDKVVNFEGAGIQNTLKIRGFQLAMKK